MANTININVNKTDMGLNNVDNTSDLNKPISTATQTALNGKENVSNKSTNTSLGVSDTLYPSQKAVKEYVDTAVNSASTPDATTLVKGKVRLAGDLGGTANSPTVPALAEKETIYSAQSADLNFRFNKKTLHATSGAGLSYNPLTGNIGVYIETPMYINVTSVMIHNDSVAPTFSSEFTKSADSLPYITGQDNYIYATLVNLDPIRIIYTIKRGGTNIYGTFLTTDLKGANNGVAELDSSGKVPSSQLPSYVDDVVDYATLSAFPVTGESGKIYIALDTNLTYRWSGSVYVEISPSLALGETSASAYRGDRGKIAYDHSQLTSGNPHNVTKSDVGLSNVDNTSDVNKPISSATQTALDNKVTGVASSVNNTVPVFDGTTGKLIKQGIITDTGSKIGIGLTNPSSQLHIRSTAVPSAGEIIAQFDVSDDSSYLRISNSTSANNTFIPTLETYNTSNQTALYTLANGTTDTGTEPLLIFDARIGAAQVATRPLFQWSNYGNVKMTMSPTGNLGIGTNTPTEKLHVNGNIVANNLSGTNTGDQDLSGYATKNITLDRKTASYTLVANDNGKLIEMNVASANTLTINASIFSAGNQILISQYGAGQTTITAGAGVTLRSSGGKLKTSAQYSLVTIVAISSTEFYVAGDLTA